MLKGGTGEGAHKQHNAIRSAVLAARTVVADRAFQALEGGVILVWCLEGSGVSRWT